MTVLKTTPEAAGKTDRTSFYKAPAVQPELVDVPTMNFLMIDGHGDPNTSQEYKEAIGALYAMSYSLKFAFKKEIGLDYRVGPLEGLWWADDMARFGERKTDWSWTMMIAQPDQLTEQRFAAMQQEVGRKKRLPGLDRIRLDSFHEGLCAQILHVGPFSAEGPTIERLHSFIRERGYGFDGRRQKHHEIYLGDPRRAAPTKWKTVIRQPIAPCA